MKLLTHTAFTTFDYLEAAANDVEAAIQTLTDSQSDLKADARRTPKADQQPQGDRAQHRWQMMYSARRGQTMFQEEHVRAAYQKLVRANEALFLSLEKSHTEATELMAQRGRDDEAAYRAALNVGVCDTLFFETSEMIAELKPKIVEPGIMNRIDAASRLKAVRRAYAVHWTNGKGWNVLPEPDAPLLTIAEAEELASKTADGLSAVPDTSYWVRIFDVEANQPGSGGQIRQCRMLISDEGLLVPRP